MWNKSFVKCYFFFRFQVHHMERWRDFDKKGSKMNDENYTNPWDNSTNVTNASNLTVAYCNLTNFSAAYGRVSIPKFFSTEPHSFVALLSMNKNGAFSLSLRAYITWHYFYSHFVVFFFFHGILNSYMRFLAESAAFSFRFNNVKISGFYIRKNSRKQVTL